MMKQDFMEKLLDGVEVEWKQLWEVTIWDKKFNAVNRKKQPSNISYPYLLAKNLFELEKDDGDIFLLSTGEQTGWTTEELAGEYIREGEVVAIPWGKSRPLVHVLKYYNGRFVTADNRIATSNNTDKLLNKYLYYWMLSNSTIIDRCYRGSGIQHPNMAFILDMKIPIPPLEIQQEIVRILDNFTELTAELTTELTTERIAREKQYNYYRDKLFAFEEGEVEWKALGNLGEFIRGKRFVKTDIISEGFPCIHYGEMYTHYNVWANKSKSYLTNELAAKLRVAEHGDVIIVAAGETIEDIGIGTAWLGEENVVIHDACFFYRSELNPKYVAYFSRTKLFNNQIKKNVASGKISAINAKGLSKAKIPIPFPTDREKSLAEQQRIVSILDKFDALTTSITEGLPREIELRQKQYEYYRDMLLSFPKEEVGQ